MNILRPILLAVTSVFLLAHTAKAHYNPNIGRWISRDPIEEDGGLNLHAFVDNSPISFADDFGAAKRDPNQPPPQQYKLDYRIISVLTPKNCGDWKWDIGWTLTPTTPNGGFIVQRVKRKTKVFDCSGKLAKQIENSDFGYREAWNVYPGGGIEFGGQDTYGGALYTGCSKGEDEIEGRAVYYDNLRKLPGDFKRRPDHSAGILLATNRYGPSLPWNTLPPQGSSNEVVRRVKVSWNCCSGVQETKVEEVRP